MDPAQALPGQAATSTAGETFADNLNTPADRFAGALERSEGEPALVLP